MIHILPAWTHFFFFFFNYICRNDFEFPKIFIDTSSTMYRVQNHPPVHHQNDFVDHAPAPRTIEHNQAENVIFANAARGERGGDFSDFANIGRSEFSIQQTSPSPQSPHYYQTTTHMQTPTQSPHYYQTTTHMQTPTLRSEF